MEESSGQPAEAERKPAGKQDATARKGGQAAGGIDPAPGDPTSPGQAQHRNAAAESEMRARGFGDHKGGDIS